MLRVLLLVSFVAACASRAAAPDTTPLDVASAPTPAAASSVDVALPTDPPDAWPHQNLAGSGASARDRVVLDALAGAFPDATWEATGGYQMFRATALGCDRAAATCKATRTDDGNVDAPQDLTVNGSPALAVMNALGELDQAYGATGTAQARCDAHGCRVAEIACVSDRHDELGAGGANQDVHRTNTCEDSRIPVAARQDR